MRKKFRIKKRPSKPVRQKNQHHETDIGYESLQSAVDQAELWGAPLVECEIEIEYGYHNDASVNLVWRGPEPVKVFEMKLVDFGRKLKLYEEWAVEFKDEIVEELALREVEDEQKNRKAVLLEKVRIKNEVIALEKKLAILGS